MPQHSPIIKVHYLPSPTSSGKKSSVNFGKFFAPSISVSRKRNMCIVEENNPSQWVLLEIKPPRTASPDILHICDICEAEYPCIASLKEHTLHCQVKTEVSKKKRCRVKRRLLAPPKSKVISSSGLERPEVGFTSKEKFLHELGLQRPNSCMPKSQTVQEPKKETFKNLVHPLWVIPSRLRLCNSNFTHSHRIEKKNSELIDLNWVRVNQICPAYPQCHRKFVPYAVPYPWRSKSRKSSAVTKMQNLQQCTLFPYVKVQRLTQREINLASHGINTQILLNQSSKNIESKTSNSQRNLKNIKAAVDIPESIATRGIKSCNNKLADFHKHSIHHRYDEGCVETPSSSPEPQKEQRNVEEMLPKKCIKVALHRITPEDLKRLQNRDGSILASSAVNSLSDLSKHRVPAKTS